MNQMAQHFTALQLARALGCKRQAVQRLLATVAPSRQIIVSGNPANVWSFTILPARVQLELEQKANRLGYRDAVHLINDPKEKWEPLVPLSEAAQHCVDKAAKLQRALVRVLSLQNDLAISSTELERTGLEDYAREFGHSITDRYLRELIKRTIERDGGANRFERLELYLDDNVARKKQPKPVTSLAAISSFHELPDLIASFKDSSAPSRSEIEYLWLRSFELLEEELSAGMKLKKARLNLLQALWRCAPFLADSSNALRVAFNRKYARWLERDRSAVALSDARTKNSGNHRAPELTTEDRD